MKKYYLTKYVKDGVDSDGKPILKELMLDFTTDDLAPYIDEFMDEDSLEYGLKIHVIKQLANEVFRWTH